LVPRPRYRHGLCRIDALHLQFFPAIKQLTLDLAAAFLGIELGPQMNAVNRAFADMVAAVIGVVRPLINSSERRSEQPHSFQNRLKQSSRRSIRHGSV
jgi:hypothetical protein